MAERWSPGAGDGAASYGVIANRSPNSALLTLGAPDLARATASALKDQRNRAAFISCVTYTRARGARAAGAALWLMAERWSPEPAMVRRATGSSPTDRQIPRTDTGRLTSLAQRLRL